MRHHLCVLSADPPSTGTELRAWRRRHGVKQRELADLVGVSRRTIIRAELRGDEALSGNFLREFAAAHLRLHDRKDRLGKVTLSTPSGQAAGNASDRSHSR